MVLNLGFCPEVKHGDHDSEEERIGKRIRPGLRTRTASVKGGPLKHLALPSERTAQAEVALENACLCARVAADNKAQDVLVLDMRTITPLFDFFIIATGKSRRQMHTLAEEIDGALRAQGETRLGQEGYEAGRWLVQDYGDIVVHLFDADTRLYYALEDLWADAPRIDWERY